MANLDNDVILAALKLARAMRRCPPDPGRHPCPPAIGRLLGCAAKNPGVSSRELCEILDVRPSSLSELLARTEADGLITRAMDEADRRIQRISLSPKGQKLITEMEAARDLDARKKTSCLTEEEKAQFCALCDKLSSHMEKLALDLPEDLRPRHPGPHGCPPPPGGPRPPFPPEPGCGAPDFPPPAPFGGRPGKDGPDEPKEHRFPDGAKFRS